MCTIRIRSAIEWPCEIAHILLWLHEHQTLVTGLLAGAGAIATVYYLRRQIDEAEQERANNLKLKQRADRALIPETLREIIEHSEERIRIFWIMRHSKTVEKETHSNRPRLGRHIVTNLRQVIESAHDNEAAIIEKLIRFTQVHASRTSGYFRLSADKIAEDRENEDEFLVPQIFDSVLLSSLASRLFTFYDSSGVELGEVWDVERAKAQVSWSILPPGGGQINIDTVLEAYFDKNWERAVERRSG